ncbi:MAG: hypothetical protein AAGC93_28915 [Cyanobacteria bacterium P01_F01_bin.53]
MTNQPSPDLDAIARNLAYLDLAHLTPEESTAYEHELSAIASLNDALETATEALTGSPHAQLWQKLTPMLSDAAALLSSQLAPLIDLNAERSFPITDSPVERPLALAAPAQH